MLEHNTVLLFFFKKIQKKAASVITAMKSKIYDNAIVTTLEPLTKFYKAEDYHQNYYVNNKSQPYCQMVIQPKMEKFENFKAD
jgi:peptide methionine sulfoxide reductase MsrA